jgi:acetyl-CoA carboxylase biotin carboxyl carrier protein
MDFSKLKEFVDLAKEMGACQLEMQEGDKKYSVSFPTASTASTMMTYQPVQAGGAPVAAASKNDSLVEITSPFVGTYYSSPSPDSPIYVKKSDKVTKGQTLCIVEAMKIMNEIESEVSGEIVEICVENESYVEFGQVLFRVKP